jgi:hypothetical protein
MWACEMFPMVQYDLLLQELHQRRTEVLQLIDELESGQQINGIDGSSLLKEWKGTLARLEQQIGEFEERNS